MIKKALILLSILICFNLFSTEKEIEQKILVFDFITNEELFLDKSLTDIFIEELKNNYNYEISFDSNKLTIKDMIDIGESQNSDKVITGRLSFFDKTYLLELTCFSVHEKGVYTKETIYERDIDSLIIKLKETAKSFFTERKISKEEINGYKKMNATSTRSGIIATRMLVGGIVTSIIAPIIFSLLILSHIGIANILGGLGVLINCLLGIITVCVGALIIGGIVLIAVGSVLLYRYTKSSSSITTDFKDNSMQISLRIRI